MTNVKTDNPLLLKIVDIAKDAEQNESKTIKLANELAQSVKIGGNWISKNDLLAYANETFDKGWVGTFLTEQSHDYRKACEDSKDRDNKNVSEAGKRRKRAIMATMGTVLLMAAYIVELPEQASATVSNKGMLLVNGMTEDGTQLALSARTCQKKARESFGRTKTRAPQTGADSKPTTSGKPIELLQAITSHYTGLTHNDITADEWAELCLLEQIIIDIKKVTKRKMAA